MNKTENTQVVPSRTYIRTPTHTSIWVWSCESTFCLDIVFTFHKRISVNESNLNELSIVLFHVNLKLLVLTYTFCKNSQILFDPTKEKRKIKKPKNSWNSCQSTTLNFFIRCWLSIFFNSHKYEKYKTYGKTKGTIKS